ncbi:hypothetical protein E2C01_051696 [Portunus trituberculatus]|uniref:Uncharacterized protein n=1 Tax=Portunus trituberculatus TaxID=210409 RepID=A0A5B7GJJ6_PORTR|nr:hypothetical protein [Portunus trituberculatus]
MEAVRAWERRSSWCQELWDKVWPARLLGTSAPWQIQTREAVRGRKAVNQIGKGWKIWSLGWHRQ